ncbi:MAG: NAD-dependent dihydropyrimidine dehydrogenase subunit PreA [Bacilli bacterium]|nr:NAD-dependent dihydropyrimidine dehydrogenase subunit PreA [Bacilli bacterium]
MNELECKLEVHKCALCHDAPCKKIYKNINPERIIRALRLENKKGARSLLQNKNQWYEKKNCDEKCPLNINIDGIIENLVHTEEIVEGFETMDIRSEICGVKLENPFLLSSSIVGSTYEMCKSALEAGWGGVCTKTICMMPIEESSPRFSALKDWDETFLGFKNIEQLSEYSVEKNMEMIRRLKKEFPNKVIIASIMGRDEQEWEYLAKEVTQAGADLIELNFSCPNMKQKGTGSDVGQNKELVEEYTRVVRKSTHLPILAKMTPNITDMRVPALAAKKGGANGISAINTIKSITGIEINSFIPEPQVNKKSSIGGYSGRAVKPIGLRYIAEMSTSEELSDMAFSGMGGIYTWRDALEYILLGCSSIQITTAIMEYGNRIIEDLILGLKIYMKENNYHTVKELVGKAKSNLVNNSELDKNTIEFPRFNYQKCIGCGRCYISCKDGGHQAIKFDETRKPLLDAKKCVGCQLCKLICPQNAIEKAMKRIEKEFKNNMTQSKKILR